MGEENLGRAVLALATDDTGLSKGLDAAEKQSDSWVKRVGGGLGKGLAVGAGIAIGAGAALTAVLGDCVSESMAAEEVQAQLEAVLKSTGGAAGVTADMANDLANSLSGVTRFEDDAILSGENMLLTFTNIGKDVFPDATKAMLDLSQATGQDLQSSAVQLGKALNDPIAGVSALSRVGVTFTEQQKAQIKAMQEAGDVAGAQKLILAELSKEFGGSATAAGKTFAGQMDILKNQLGNVKEEIGGALLPVLADLATQYGPQVIQFAKDLAKWIVESLIPAIVDVAGWINANLIPALRDIFTWIGANVVPVIKDLVLWLGTNIPPAITTVKDFINNDLIPAVQGAWQKFEDFRQKVISIKDAIVGAFEGAVGGVKSALNSIISLMNAAIRAFNALPGPDIGEIPLLDSGVRNFAGGWAVVGERGPELVRLPAGADVYSARESAGRLGNTYYIDARGSQLTEGQIRRQFELALAAAGRGADTRGRMR